MVLIAITTIGGRNLFEVKVQSSPNLPRSLALVCINFIGVAFGEKLSHLVNADLYIDIYYYVKSEYILSVQVLPHPTVFGWRAALP